MVTMNKFNRIPKEKEKEEDSSVKTNTFPTNCSISKEHTTSRAQKSTEEKEILEREKKNNTNCARHRAFVMYFSLNLNVFLECYGKDRLKFCTVKRFMVDYA